MKTLLLFASLGLFAQVALMAQGPASTHNSIGGQQSPSSPQVSTQQAASYNREQTITTPAASSRVEPSGPAPERQVPQSRGAVYTSGATVQTAQKHNNAVTYSKGSDQVNTKHYTTDVARFPKQELKDPHSTAQHGAGQIVLKPAEKSVQSYNHVAYNLHGRSKPVLYFKKKQLRACELAGYGVQIAYYKNLSQCRKDLEKYRSYFKVAGFVAEDLNLDEFRYRLILGHYPYKGFAERLLLRIRSYFPFCFIVKYA